jgi:hypothetical protein
MPNLDDTGARIAGQTWHHALGVQGTAKDEFPSPLL